MMSSTEAAIWTGLILYGLGPNLVIGVPAAAGTGAKALGDVIQGVWLKHKAFRSISEEEKRLLEKRISELKWDSKKHASHCAGWLVSAIPIVGPAICVYAFR